MGIRIKYFTDSGGEERVRISGMNGEPMFTSEGYTQTEGAVHAINVMANAFKDGDVVIDDELPPAPEDEETGDEMVVEDQGTGDDALD